MFFAICSCIFGAACCLFAFVLIEGEHRWPDFTKGLPRNRLLGEIIGVIALSWAAYHVCGMLEGNLARYRIVIKVLVPVIALLSYNHLDYLFARALGGFILLTVNMLLHEAFSVGVPCRPVFSIICYLVGFAGLVLIAAPWQMRDLFERCRSRRQACWRSVGIIGVLGVCFIVFGVVAL